MCLWVGDLISEALMGKLCSAVMDSRDKLQQWSMGLWCISLTIAKSQSAPSGGQILTIGSALVVVAKTSPSQRLTSSRPKT